MQNSHREAGSLSVYICIYIHKVGYSLIINPKKCELDDIQEELLEKLEAFPDHLAQKTGTQYVVWPSLWAIRNTCTMTRIQCLELWTPPIDLWTSTPIFQTQHSVNNGEGMWRLLLPWRGAGCAFSYTVEPLYSGHLGECDCVLINRVFSFRGLASLHYL